MPVDNKKQSLTELLTRLAQKDTLLAFSGGADSSLVLALLAKISRELNTTVHAVYVHTSLMPNRDRVLAERFAHSCGVDFEVIELNEWNNPHIVANTPDRCYHCKKALLSAIIRRAGELGIDTILDGTNHDDLNTYRPGLRALRELNIQSPLASVGFSKPEVYAYLKELGLEGASQPASPCLATRIPYGHILKPETLRRVEMAEEFLRTLPLHNIRVRCHEDIARIEIDEAFFDIFLLHRKAVLEKMKSLGFTYVTLDIEGFRSGSLDAKLTLNA